MEVKALVYRYSETDILANQIHTIRIEDTLVFCCNEMKISWKHKSIGFGNMVGLSNKDCNVNIYSSEPPHETAINECLFCMQDIVVTLNEAGVTLIEKLGLINSA